MVTQSEKSAVKPEPTFSGQVIQLNAQTLAALQNSGIQAVQLDGTTGSFTLQQSSGQSMSQIIQIPPNISQQALLNSLQAAAGPGQRIIVQSIPNSTATSQIVQPLPPAAAPPSGTAGSGVPVQIGITGPNGQITYQTVNIPWSVLQSGSGAAQALNIVPVSGNTNSATASVTSTSAAPTNSVKATSSTSTAQNVSVKDELPAGNVQLTTVSANQLTPILIQHNGQLVQAYNVTNAVRSGNFSLQGLSNGQGTIQVCGEIFLGRKSGFENFFLSEKSFFFLLCEGVFLFDLYSNFSF
jgi:hypothetical protein